MEVTPVVSSSVIESVETLPITVNVISTEIVSTLEFNTLVVETGLPDDGTTKVNVTNEGVVVVPPPQPTIVVIEIPPEQSIVSSQGSQSITAVVPDQTVLVVDAVHQGVAGPPGPPGGSGLTLEEVDDRVAAMIVPGSGIGIVYNDQANSLTISSTSPPITTKLTSYFPSGW